MTLTDRIKAIQSRVGVKPDGMVGERTIAALEGVLGLPSPGNVAGAATAAGGVSVGPDGVSPLSAHPGGPQAQKTGLADPGKFFAAVRDSFGALEQSQVDGFNVLLAAMGAAAWPIAFAAYALATAWHETARTMQPVEESFWKDDAWRKANLRYYPWHGRGYVQLTWERNYKRADDELALGGALTAQPRKAMEPEIAARILVGGMAEGWFTGKSLAHYLPRHGSADARMFALARYIINGQDKAAEIAQHALKFQTALALGGWA